MDSKLILQYEWPYLLTFLPSMDELEKSAKEMGALTRKRHINSASDLLRLAFAYGFCGLSLRQATAWAEVADIAHLSDVALLKRLRASSEWLGYLLGLKLAEKAPPPLPFSNRYRLKLVDATTISRPGSTGTDWRIHLGFDLSSFKIDHIELTDFSGGETLTRFPFHEGDIVLGDRGYSHRKGLYAVVNSKADFLVRLNWRNVPLQQASGETFDFFNALRGIDDTIPCEFPVQIAPSAKEGIPALPARLLAIRKSETAAEESRKKILYEHSRKSRAIDPRTLEAAGYICVLTSLPQEVLGTKDGLDLYRFRWQIEVVFKRMKSLLELGQLPAKDPPLARSFIYAKLLAALLIEELTSDFLSFSPWGYRLAREPTFNLADSKSAL
jgi:hypothetical protein